VDEFPIDPGAGQAARRETQKSKFGKIQNFINCKIKKLENIHLEFVSARSISKLFAASSFSCSQIGDKAFASLPAQFAIATAASLLRANSVPMKRRHLLG
jgi:hypothetical protein